jgi:Ca2+-transporting ATPase
MGLPAPFNTFELLWINVIMDGPPALTLGLEKASDKLMSQKPVRRTDGIVNLKMFIRILIGGIFIGVIMILQYLYNFLGVKDTEQKGVVFTLFILFQLFNAFNARELGSVSVFKNIKSNKPMLLVFGITFLLQVLLSQYLGAFFGTVALPISVWLKMILTASSIVLISEIYKFIKRIINSQTKKENSIKGLIKNNNNA